MTFYKTKNFFNNIPQEIPEEIFECLVNSEHVKIEKIITKGQITRADEYYNQEKSEWIMVLKGEAVISFVDPYKEIRLNVGDYLLIPAHKRHRVEWTVPDKITLWIAIHF